MEMGRADDLPRVNRVVGEKMNRHMVRPMRPEWHILKEKSMAYAFCTCPFCHIRNEWWFLKTGKKQVLIGELRCPHERSGRPFGILAVFDRAFGKEMLRQFRIIRGEEMRLSYGVRVVVVCPDCGKEHAHGGGNGWEGKRVPTCGSGRDYHVTPDPYRYFTMHRDELLRAIS
jgi:hypothetical protein